jgi:hypothetical protein
MPTISYFTLIKCTELYYAINFFPFGNVRTDAKNSMQAKMRITSLEFDAVCRFEWLTLGLDSGASFIESYRDDQTHSKIKYFIFISKNK